MASTSQVLIHLLPWARQPPTSQPGFTYGGHHRWSHGPTPHSSCQPLNPPPVVHHTWAPKREGPSILWLDPCGGALVPRVHRSEPLPGKGPEGNLIGIWQEARCFKTMVPTCMLSINSWPFLTPSTLPLLERLLFFFF